ncbi:MAG: hypothetical protein LBR72_06225 [Oscillospiraceae bacterium]|jgi:hypothetical protein|nr:hypothetical protein [Oscillospiraceae bacterium]
MALVKGKCPRCGAEVQLEGQNRVGFCLICGGKINVADAVERLEKQTAAASVAPVDRTPEKMLDAQAFLTQANFDAAEQLYEELLTADPKNWGAVWGLVLAQTRNLKPIALKDPDGFSHAVASDLFARGGSSVEQAWRDAYWAAFAESCRMTVDAVDPRVFLELEIYRWYPHSNTFMYPISRDFDIQPILNKVLWSDWKVLAAALPEEMSAAFIEQAEQCCRRIREYFLSGFKHMEELRSGDLTRLMGTWYLKLTTGAIKTDVLSVTRNTAGVLHMEGFRTSVNSYDHYRYVQVDHNNRLTAGEYRHFPSSTGIGGDFVANDPPEPVAQITAVYDYVLILPTALYSRLDQQKIPNIDRALIYIQQCKTMPCFMRISLKNAYQMRPIMDNEETAEPTKKMRACYIATAVYGSDEAPEVRRLRRWRDEFLNTTRPGRRLCAFYYAVSPKLAEKLPSRSLLSRLIRRLLDGFVRMLGE